MNASIYDFHKKQGMRTGSCNVCGPSGPAYGASSAQQLADSMGRALPGVNGRCKYNLLPFAIDVKNDATDTTVHVESPIAICTESLIAFVQPDAVFLPGQALLFKDLTFGNRPQWVIGQDYDADLFGLDSECSCCLPGDCLNVGTPVSLTAHFAIAQAGGTGTTTAYFYVRGPSID